MKSPQSLGVPPGSVLHGKQGILLLFGSLLVLSSLLTIVSWLYLGMSIWVLAPLLLWGIFFIYLLRFKAGAFGFWKLVFVFIIYVFALSALIFTVIPGKQTPSIPSKTVQTH